MLRRRAFVLVVPVLLIAVLLGTYLYSLPRAVTRAHRSPCVLLGVQTAQLEKQPRELVFTDLRGQPYEISRLQGRLVLVNFWLTTCQPCLEELPSLLDLASRYGNRGLVLVLVSTDKKRQAIDAFLKKIPRLSNLPPAAVIVWDPGGQIARSLGTKKYPETYLVHADGRWGGRVVGARAWTGRAATACLTSRLP